MACGEGNKPGKRESRICFSNAAEADQESKSCARGVMMIP